MTEALEPFNDSPTTSIDDLLTWEVIYANGQIDRVRSYRLENFILRLEFKAQEAVRDTRSNLYLTLNHEIIGIPELADANEIIASILWKLHDAQVVSVQPVNADRSLIQRDSHGLPLIANCAIVYQGGRLLAYQSEKSSIQILLCRCPVINCILSFDSFCPGMTLGRRPMSEEDVNKIYGTPNPDIRPTIELKNTVKPIRKFPRGKVPDYEKIPSTEIAKAETAHAPWHVWFNPNAIILDQLVVIPPRLKKISIAAQTAEIVISASDRSGKALPDDFHRETTKDDFAQRMQNKFWSLFNHLLTTDLPVTDEKIRALHSLDLASRQQIIRILIAESFAIQKQIHTALNMAHRSPTETALVNDQELSLAEIEYLILLANLRADWCNQLFNYNPDGLNPQPSTELLELDLLTPSTNEANVSNADLDESTTPTEQTQVEIAMITPASNPEISIAESPSLITQDPDTVTDQRVQVCSIITDKVAADEISSEKTIPQSNQNSDQTASSAANADSYQIATAPNQVDKNTQQIKPKRKILSVGDEKLAKKESKFKARKNILCAQTSQPNPDQEMTDSAQARISKVKVAQDLYFYLFRNILTRSVPQNENEIEIFFKIHEDRSLVKAEELSEQADRARALLYEKLRAAKVSRSKCADINGNMIAIEEIDAMLLPANNHSLLCRSLVDMAKYQIMQF